MTLPIIYITIIILLIILFIIINKITIKKNNILNARSCIDIYLKKRYDLIPSLVKVIKAYCNHEQNLFKELINLRNLGLKANNYKEIKDINNKLESDLKSIMLLSEDYPDLKDDINFIKLQTILTDVENELSAARRTYNAHVTNYNNFISIIPINLIALLFHFKKENLFTLSSKERKNQKWVKEDE